MENWKTVRLGDVCEQIRGVSYKPADLHNELDDNSVILLRANNIFGDALNYDELVYVDNKKVSDSQYLKKGDILICASSGSKNLVGKAACLEEDRKLTFGAFCKVLRTDSVNHGFFKHYFFSPSYRSTISSLSAGANINNIRAEDLDNLLIPLPPLEEQKHIAAQLDKCTAVIAKHKQMLEKYDMLIKSRFIEMFGDNPTKNGKWQISELGTLSEIGSSKRIFANEYVSEGIPFYRSKEIRELGNRERPSIELYISYEKYNEIKTKYGLPKKNDILIAAIGATIGYTWIIDTDSPFYYKDGNLILISNIKKLDSIFLNEILKTEIKAYKDRASGSAQLALTIEKMERLQIPVPPLELQNDFAAFVQQIDKSKFAVQKSLEKAETLYKSLMQEYFA